MNGKLKCLPGGGLGKKHAEFEFDSQDIRFTVGKSGALYAFTMNVPEEGQTITIHSMAKGSKYLGGKKIRSVSLLGYNGKLRWKQTTDGLVIIYPKGVNLKTSAVLKIS